MNHTNTPIIGALSSSPLIRRHPANPVLDAARVPYPTALVFNAGVVKFGGRYVMVFRNDYGSLEKQTLEPSHTTDLVSLSVKTAFTGRPGPSRCSS